MTLPSTRAHTHTLAHSLPVQNVSSWASLMKWTQKCSWHGTKHIHHTLKAQRNQPSQPMAATVTIQIKACGLVCTSYLATVMWAFGPAKVFTLARLRRLMGESGGQVCATVEGKSTNCLVTSAQNGKQPYQAHTHTTHTQLSLYIVHVSSQASLSFGTAETPEEVVVLL